MRGYYFFILMYALIFFVGCGASAPGPDVISFDAKIESEKLNLENNYWEYTVSLRPIEFFGNLEQIGSYEYVSMESIDQYDNKRDWNVYTKTSTQPFGDFFSYKNSKEYDPGISLKQAYHQGEKKGKFYVRPRGGYTLAHPSEYLKIPANSEIKWAKANLIWSDLKWKSKHEKYYDSYDLTHKIPIVMKCYDFEEILNKRYLKGEIYLNVIDAQTALPIEEFEVIITEILPQGQLLAAHFSSEFKQNNYARKICNSEWLQEWIARKYDFSINQSLRYSNRFGGARIPAAPRISRKQDELRILVRAKDYKFFEGIVSYDGDMKVEYTIKLPRVGTNINMQITEPIKSSINKK